MTSESLDFREGRSLFTGYVHSAGLAGILVAPAVVHRKVKRGTEAVSLTERVRGRKTKKREEMEAP